MAVVIQVKNMEAVVRKLNYWDKRLDNDRWHGLIRAVHNIADVWGRNFQQEGASSGWGTWAGLHEYTQRVRREQGFNPEHPILVRSGALRSAAIESFKYNDRRFRQVFYDNYSDQATEAGLWSHSTFNRNSVNYQSLSYATLEVKGWKVNNQWGDDRPVMLPVRQFWFVDTNVRGVAKDGLIEWLVTDVFR